MVFLVILQISTCKNVATKHTIPQNTEIFGFLGSKYQIITRLGHQDENRPYKVLVGRRNQVLNTFFKLEK